MVAGSPESSAGVAHAWVWRRALNGQRLATRTAPPTDPLQWTPAAHLEVAANGNVLVLPDEMCRHRLPQIVGMAGELRWDSGVLPGRPVDLAQATHGHSLVSASMAGCGPGPSWQVWIDDTGRVCRQHARSDLHALRLAHDAPDRLLAGVTPFVPGVGQAAVAES